MAYHIIGTDGAVHGPVDRPTLDVWLAEGRIGPETLVHGGTAADWTPLNLHPDLAQPPPPVGVDVDLPSRTPRPSRPRIVVFAAAIALFALIASGIVVALPLVGAGRLDLLPDVVAAGLRGSGATAPRPQPPARSDAPSVRSEPLPGIRIEAPAGALDQKRSFTARQLDAPRFADADRRLSQGGLIALGGWDIDAGMADEDLFHEPATFSFDLDELGIPAQFHSDIVMANIDAEGTVMLVPGRLKGRTLSIKARHNGAWLPVLIPALLKTIDYAWTKDREEVPTGDFAAIHWKPGDVRYRLLYPRSWPARNPSEVKRVEAELERILVKHKLTPADVRIKAPSKPADAPPAIALDPFSDIRDMGEQLGERIERIRALGEDPDFQAVRDTARDERWVKENLLPPRVTNAVTALDRGWDYLDSRGFRKPGIAKFQTVTDVFIVEHSLGAELMAEVHNTWTTSPFIVFDGTKIPDADLGSFDSAQKATFDEFQSTAMHELFHVVQASYSFMDRNRFLWFSEAAAVMLEHEAEEYYRKKGFIDTWKTTVRSYESFHQPMEYYYPDEARPNQQHGYGQSYFWEFLRDYHFTLSGSRDRFLPNLYEDFASFRGGPVESLYRTTGGSEESLSKAFYAFTYSAANDIQTAYEGLDPKKFKKITATLEAKKTPLQVMRFESGGHPLSVQMMEVKVPGASMSPGPAAPADPVYVLSTNGIEQHGAIVRVGERTPGAKMWDEIRGGCVLSALSRQFVMRAETYVRAPGAVRNAGGDASAHGPIVFGMFAGAEPTVDVKDQLVTISWKPSVPAAMKRPDGTGALISGYRVTLTMPDGRTTTFAATEPKVELPVATLDKLIAASKQADKNRVFRLLHGIGQQDAITLINMSEALSAGLRPKIRVTYREVAAIPGSPMGPPSEAAEFEYGDEARTAKDVTGTWAGRVPFSEGNLMRIDIIETGGGDFIGTMHWGEAIPIRGTWNASSRSWALQGRESNVWMPMFLIFDGHLQKLPGDKLYLFAPPAVLSRHSDRAPDLGWRPDPGDMELKQLLEQLQREMNDLNAPAEGSAP